MQGRTLFRLITLICIGIAALALVSQASAAALKDVHVEPSEVVGGEPINVTVSLERAGVAHPKIRSSFPQIVPIPNQTVAIVNRSYATVQFPTNVVDQAVDVAITATLGRRSIAKVVRVLPPTYSTDVELRIEANQMPYLLKYAREQGFRFTATRTLNSTRRCSVDASARDGLFLEIVRPRTPSNFHDEVGACAFVIFDGRELADGFTFVKEEMVIGRSRGAIGVKWQYIEGPRSGSNMRMIIAAESRDPTIPEAVVISEIVLHGPPGSKWEDAFR